MDYKTGAQPNKSTLLSLYSVFISCYNLCLKVYFVCFSIWFSHMPESCLTLATHGLLRPWDSPGKNTGVGCHFPLQEIFPTQGSNLSLLHCRQILYQLSCEGSPYQYSHSNSLSRHSCGISFSILLLSTCLCLWIQSRSL